MRKVKRKHKITAGIVAAVLATGVVGYSQSSNGFDKPIKALTPGHTLSVDLATLCTAGYTATVRSVPSSVRAQVFAEYGQVDKPNKWEVDHLISLELGGDNSLQNLWPQPLGQARQKDITENRLHKEVCDQTITLAEAQAEVLDPHNWGH